MIVSDKQLSIGVIALFFAGILGYFFLWFGYVEIFINHAEVANFEVNSREKIYKCTENPCRIKVRARKKFIAQVNHDLAENKTISISRIPFLKTEKIVIQAKKELAEAKTQRISREFLQPDLFSVKQAFGPILTAEDGKFAIFARNFTGKLEIYIKNKSSEQLLTTIEDEFLPIFLEKNFSLTNSGIVIPAKNRVYYYDFATQRKFKILEINSLRISDISVSKKGNEVVFYNLKEKIWQKYFINSQELENIGEANFAGFWDDQELEIQDNIIYLDGKKSQKIPLKIESNNLFSIRENSLIVEQDFEAWQIDL